MSLTTSEMTPADIAAVTGGNRNDGMFGGDGAWWIIILFLFVFCGWGNNGWGGNGSGGQSGYDTRADIQRGFDNSTVISKLDGLNTGLCDGFYAMNTGMLNGFNGVQQTLCQGFSSVNASINGATNSIQQSIQADTMANLQNTNALARQLADCCCENRAAIAQVRYDMATQACDTRNTIQNGTRDIIENANANSRAILDALNQNYVRTLENENQSLRLAASQSNQNAVLMAAMDANKAEILRRTGAECPTPAYVVQPPQPVTFPNFCNTGCCCASSCGC